MGILTFGAGLTPDFASPPLRASEPEDVITEEAGIRPPLGRILRITPLVEEDAPVAQGASVACLRDAPDICFVAPMSARVARLSMLPGRKLSEIVLFHEAGGDVVQHDTGAASTEVGLRQLMQRSGLWPWIRRRPFGDMPPPSERPAAILVMGVDTRPLAPDPRLAIEGKESSLARGLAALEQLTDGPVFLSQPRGAPLIGPDTGSARLRRVDCGPRHPQGSAGLICHDICPATLDLPVWDIHAEDVAALGTLLETGSLPMARLTSVAGDGLREARLVRTQPGADMRALTERVALPGTHVILSGSPLDGHKAKWLAPRDRQVTVQHQHGAPASRQWLIAALNRSAVAKPVIPTAALTQAFGAALPAVPLIRALSSGDDDLAMRLGVLCLLEEDVALADYVLGGDAHLAGVLRAMLERIRTEYAA